MRRNRAGIARVVAAHVFSSAVTLTMIVLAPVIVLVGEPLRRYYLRRIGRRPKRSRSAQRVIANPAFIALTAPGRWAIDRVADLGSGSSGRFGFRRRGGRGDWPPPAGTREPRRPRPNAPAGAIALAEPRQQHRVIPIRKVLLRALRGLARRSSSRLRRLAMALRARAGHRLA